MDYEPAAEPARPLCSGAAAAELSLPAHPSQVPRKRFRGRKRYYRRVLAKARAFSMDLAASDWFDLWHYHADWPGYGNRGARDRRNHLEALCIVFGTLARAAETRPEPYQLWLYLDGEDAGQDAVYLHTPNPNRDSYPVVLEGVRWGVPELERLLQRYLPALPMRAGLRRHNGSTSYFAYSAAHGEPLDNAAHPIVGGIPKETSS